MQEDICRFRLRWGALLVLALLVGGARAGAVERGLLLARDAKAALPIVVSHKATPKVKAVAAELADYLSQMTGATFEVTPGDGSRGIVVGTLDEFPNPALDKPLEMRGRFDGREAFAIRTEPQRLLLIGRTELGASHAVFRFLEAQGCRWFFPAKEWSIVPRRPTLRVAVDETDRPVLLSRRIWYQWGIFDRRAAEAYRAWARHNRMAASLGIYCGHAWQAIVAHNRAAFEQHPEYLALVRQKDGTRTRQGTKFCVSNPALRQLVVDYALEWFARNPTRDMISVDPSDGGGHCECEPCAKTGPVSDRVFFLANQVARAVAKKHPGRLVGLYAYNYHTEPPSFALEPNVYVQLTTAFTRGRYTFDELAELWPKKCRSMGFYDYYSVFQWNHDMLPGGHGANVPRMRTTIPRFVSLNATSIDAESGNNWGLHGRGYLVANRLMWNPKADVDALLADFYANAFGPAAAAMKRYYERLDPGNEPLMSQHLLALAFRDVAQATKLAAERPDVLARLDHLKIYLRYAHLRWLLDHTRDRAEQKRLTLAIFTHVYRSRYTYMNHWEAIRQFWTTRAAKQFGEPAWKHRTPPNKQPWRVDAPYTRQAIAAFFQEGLDYFQPQKVQEKAFSADLVRVRFGDDRRAASRDPGMFQRGLRYALFSDAGEPLAVAITPGTIAWYRDRADARYTVTDAKGNPVAEGRLKLDGEKHALKVAVPRAGLYYLDFNDSAAGWRIEAEPGRALSIVLRRSRGALHHGHMQPMFFYVPKGTRAIHYYWRGGPHRVHGPDGKVVREVADSGTFIAIPVPAGADGKVWRFTRFALKHLWFFNLPNCLAPSPNALLVPREVAASDGLPDPRAR